MRPLLLVIEKGSLVYLGRKIDLNGRLEIHYTQMLRSNVLPDFAVFMTLPVSKGALRECTLMNIPSMAIVDRYANSLHQASTWLVNVPRITFVKIFAARSLQGRENPAKELLAKPLRQ